LWISGLPQDLKFAKLLSGMNSLTSTIRHLIIKTYWTMKALFVCPVLTFVGSNGVMYMGGENEEEKCGEECGCSEKEKECDCAK